MAYVVVGVDMAAAVVVTMAACMAGLIPKPKNFLNDDFRQIT